MCQLVGIRLTFIVTLLEAIFKRHHKITLLRQIKEIDEIFSKVFGVDLQLDKNYRKNVWRVVGHVGFAFTMQLSDLITRLQHGEGVFIGYWLSYIIPFLTSTVCYLEVYAMIDLVEIRLKKLNELTGKFKLSSTQQTKFVATVFHATKLTVSSDLSMLVKLKDLHDRLWNTINTINDCYGFALLMNVVNDIVSITASTFLLYISFQKYIPWEICSSIFSGIVHFTNIILLSNVCDRLIDTSRQTPLLVHRIDTEFQNYDWNVCVRYFETFVYKKNTLSYHSLCPFVRSFVTQEFTCGFRQSK